MFLYGFSGLSLAALLLGLSAEGVAAQTRKCVYWFNFCVSCEAPLTCTNSRPVDTRNRLSGTRNRLLPRSTPPKVSKPAPKTVTPPTKRTETAKVPLRGPLHSTDEFRYFKEFIQQSQTVGVPPTDDEIRELYLRYKVWAMTQHTDAPNAQ